MSQPGNIIVPSPNTSSEYVLWNLSELTSFRKKLTVAADRAYARIALRPALLVLPALTKCVVSYYAGSTALLWFWHIILPI
jgi:hypothetical protein